MMALLSELLLLISITGALWFLFNRISYRLGFAEPITVFTEKIQTLLPQTQCGQCQYSGCQPYADAIAHNMAQINRCPPGGDTGMATLADYLGRPALPLVHPELCMPEKQIAFIDEQRCIGCTLCIKACPVDAIIGAARQMHTVIHNQCNGCRLCIAPCPVDCITMRGTGDQVYK